MAACRRGSTSRLTRRLGGDEYGSVPPLRQRDCTYVRWLLLLDNYMAGCVSVTSSTYDNAVLFLAAATLLHVHGLVSCVCAGKKAVEGRGVFASQPLPMGTRLGAYQ